MHRVPPNMSAFGGKADIEIHAVVAWFVVLVVLWDCPHTWRKMWIAEHLLAGRDVQSAKLVLALHDGPRGAAMDTQRLGLVIQCVVTRSGQALQ